MLAEILPQLRGGVLPRRKQDSTLATVMPKRAPKTASSIGACPRRSLRLGARAHPSVSGSILSPRRTKTLDLEAEPSRDRSRRGTFRRARSLSTPSAGRSSQPVTAGFALLSIELEGEAEQSGIAAARLFPVGTNPANRESVERQ